VVAGEERRRPRDFCFSAGRHFGNSDDSAEWEVFRPRLLTVAPSGRSA
jgi:hypothetical protein